MVKTHRQTRSSKTVSSETGCAVGAEKESPRFYSSKLDQLMSILRSVPPVERRRMLADALKQLEG